MHRFSRGCLFLAVLFAAWSPAAAEPVHAIAMHGTPKLSEGFASLPYANPDAPKGGRLRLGMAGSFDSVNPMIVKGEKVAGVREFSVESLMMRGLEEPFTALWAAGGASRGTGGPNVDHVLPQSEGGLRRWRPGDGR